MFKREDISVFAVAMKAVLGESKNPVFAVSMKAVAREGRNPVLAVALEMVACLTEDGNLTRNKFQKCALSTTSI